MCNSRYAADIPFLLPNTQLPPTRSEASKHVNGIPRSWRAWAAAMPDEPAPMMAAVGRLDMGGRDLACRGRRDAGPGDRSAKVTGASSLLEAEKAPVPCRRLGTGALVIIGFRPDGSPRARCPQRDIWCGRRSISHVPLSRRVHVRNPAPRARP